MALITLLICLAIQRFFSRDTHVYCEGWFEGALHAMSSVIAKVGAWGAVIVVIVPVVVVLFIVNWLLSGLYFGIVQLLFGVVVLLLCMDARDQGDFMQDYLKARERGDQQGALEHAKKFVENGPITDEATLNRVVTCDVLLKAQDSIFSVIFWYLVLGVCGAALYAMVALFCRYTKRHDHPAAEPAQLVHDALMWIPVRLLGLTYALAGHFTVGFAYCLTHIAGGLSTVRTYAVQAGLASLDLDRPMPGKEGQINENKIVLDLVNRAVVIWIVAVALITLGALLN